MSEQYFIYGDRETDYLKSKDKRLAAVIDRVGNIRRTCIDDPFEAVVNSIVGQQISTKAHQSIWKRIKDDSDPLTPDIVREMGIDRLRTYGISGRKADYIMEFSEKVRSGAFDIAAFRQMSDEDAIAALCTLRGVGVWTAEMILLFCLRRPNIFSYADFGIRRGVRMVYRHKKLPWERFEQYRKRFSPYCSVASLYFWAVAGGKVPELTDPAESE